MFAKLKEMLTVDDRRVAPRVEPVGDCFVELDGHRFALKNWSLTGLFFGPCDLVVPKQKIYLRLCVKDDVVNIDFPVEAVVARVQPDGMVGAFFYSMNPGLKKQIIKYFTHQRALAGDEN
ncbi:MAG: PilZ domain-containing protein [Oceanibaculum sp.]